MNTWKLTFPDTALFEFVLHIRVSDLNYGNHLGNDRIVGLLHEARMQFLRTFGYTEMNVEGVGLILRDLSVELKKEMFYGDRLRIEIAVPEWSATGFRMVYRVCRTEETEEVVTALAHTTLICFDYNSEKPVRVPENLMAHRFQST